jgi:hypothetical protein
MEGWVVPAGLGIGDGLVAVVPQALHASEMRRSQRTGSRGFTGELHRGLDERRHRRTTDYLLQDGPRAAASLLSECSRKLVTEPQCPTRALGRRTLRAVPLRVLRLPSVHAVAVTSG